MLDSRGNPTVEAEVATEFGVGRASVPSGASKGTHEALELRDGDARRYHGKGVKKAVTNVNKLIRPEVVGSLVSDQEEIDGILVKLDGKSNKSRLGANAILAVSMATAKAAAIASGNQLYFTLKKERRYRLPVPMMNIINGGEHAGNELAIQEFMVEPVGTDSCTEAIRMGDEVYQSLKTVLTDSYGKVAINVGDEGGFAPPLSKTREALDAIRKAVKASGYGEGEVKLGIDAAASVFFDSKSSSYALDGKSLDSGQLEEYYVSLGDEYGLLTIEDPFAEEAFDEFASLTRRLGRRMKIIGDDLYATNVSRMRKGFRMKATNAVLVKLNQIGTVSETLGAIELARRARWAVAVSHRSGETEDPFIAHLATAMGSEFIKTGAPARGERVAKYNELMRIEEGLGSHADFAGKMFRS